MQRRLLIAELCPDTAGVLAAMARTFGCKTLIADTGQAALEIADWWKPDLVTIDVELPNIDGHAVAHAMRAVLKTTRLIGVSGSANGYAFPGFDHFLVRPVTLERFKEALG